MIKAGLVVLILLIGLSGCGGDGDTVPVVVSAPVSTEPWIAGSIQHGAQLAVDEINADGGVQLKAGKKKLKLVVLDNGGSPATALANAREAVKRNAAALLTDGTGAVSVASVTDPAKLPVFVLFDGGPSLIDPQAHPSVFRLAPADAIMTRRLADYIANARPKVAMVTDDSTYGREGRKALRDSFTVDQVRVVSDVVIPRRSTDLAPQILQAR